MYLHEPYGIAATSSHITHSREQHLLISDSLYDFSTFKRKRLVILEPKQPVITTTSHYQSSTSHYQDPNSTTSHSRTMTWQYGPRLGTGPLVVAVASGDAVAGERRTTTLQVGLGTSVAHAVRCIYFNIVISYSVICEATR